MNSRILPINLPLPDLSGEDAIEFTEFLYELAGRVEASYRPCIDRYYYAADQQRAEKLCQMLFDADHTPQQLELFDDLEPF
jgi:hypothetical protein